MNRSKTKIGDREYEDMGDELPETRCIGYFLGWVRFVEECERGYDAGMEEYFNDLHWRSSLERQLEKIPDSNFKTAILIFTKSIDENFKKLLVENETQVQGWVTNKDKENHWWCWGIVKNAKGLLKQDLEERAEDIKYYKTKKLS